MKSSTLVIVLTALVTLFGSFSSMAEDEDLVAESSKAAASISSHEKRVKAAQIRYVQECITSTKRLISELERVRGEEIRRENLRTAKAIQDRLTSYEKMLESYRESLASLRLGGAVNGSGDATRRPNRLYLWNAARRQDRGVLEVDIELRKGGQLVKEMKGIELNRKNGEATRNIIELPDDDFDELRIKVMRWHSASAGLAELALANNKTDLTSDYKIHAPLRGTLSDDPRYLNDGKLDTEWYDWDGRRSLITLKLKKPDPEAARTPNELQLGDEGDDPSDDQPELDSDGFFGLPTEKNE